MSKMSQVMMELEEQAAELGFTSLADAEAAGYTWRTDEQDGVAFGVLYKSEDEADQEAEQELDEAQGITEAHLAWLAERELVMQELAEILKRKTTSSRDRTRIEHAINFIRMGEI